MTINYTSHDLPPWQDHPVPFFLRVIGYLVILCLIGVIIWSVLDLTTAVATGSLRSQASPGIIYVLQHGVLPVTGILAGIIGWLAVRRYAFGNDDFRLKNRVPASEMGIPFTILMDRPVDGWGMLLFGPDGLELRAKARGFEAVNVLDIIRAIFFQLARYVVKKMLRTYEANYTIAYPQVTDIKVTGRRVVLYSPDESIKVTKFKVSSADGERLYRELNAHFPNAIEEWRHLLA